MNDLREKDFICCKNCKHREKYTYHCSVLDRDILLTDYCSMSFFERREDVPNCGADMRGEKDVDEVRAEKIERLNERLFFEKMRNVAILKINS